MLWSVRFQVLKCLSFDIVCRVDVDVYVVFTVGWEMWGLCEIVVVLARRIVAYASGALGW